jgi:predicted transcriptional regulator
VGCVTTKQIKDVPKEEWDQKSVGELAQSCTQENSIEPDKDATEALAAMQKNGASRLMVVDQGKVVGIISLKDMLELISLRVELEEE